MAQNVKLKKISFEDNPNRNPDGTFASSGGDQTGGGQSMSSIRNLAFLELHDKFEQEKAKLMSGLEDATKEVEKLDAIPKKDIINTKNEQSLNEARDQKIELENKIAEIEEKQKKELNIKSINQEKDKN